MRLETSRQKKQKAIRHRNSVVLSMVLALLVVFALGIVLWNGKNSLEEKNREYEAEINQLNQEIEAESQRTDELAERQKYVQTKKYVEEVAKSKFGLVYPDEIIFKTREKN
ncbi:MAG: septum formation initiator family protein [Lachnospira sp.]